MAAEFDGFEAGASLNDPGLEKVTDVHAASFSRTVSRLIDRGLVKPRGAYGPSLALAASEGVEAASELDRRERDGRYSITFAALDELPSHSDPVSVS